MLDQITLEFEGDPSFVSATYTDEGVIEVTVQRDLPRSLTAPKSVQIYSAKADRVVSVDVRIEASSVVPRSSIDLRTPRSTAANGSLQAFGSWTLTPLIGTA